LAATSGRAAEAKGEAESKAEAKGRQHRRPARLVCAETKKKWPVNIRVMQISRLGAHQPKHKATQGRTHSLSLPCTHLPLAARPICALALSRERAASSQAS